MAHDTGGPGDVPSTEEDEYVDVDEELEPDSTERQGFISRTREKLGEAKDKYVGWHTVDEPKHDKGLAGSNISRRGFVAGRSCTGSSRYIRCFRSN